MQLSIRYVVELPLSPTPVHTAMPGRSPWASGSSALFEEWCALAGGSELRPSDIKPLGKGDALVIIDLQKDFVPGDVVTNPQGGRFGVAEGDHIVQPIVSLISSVVTSGATCIATRDYHPHDHVSFMSEGGPFPEHCVQGTPGAQFMPPIAVALSAAHKARPTDVHIAFKAFHEDADSFGALPYFKGGESRLSLRSPGNASSSYCVGCAACPWTGSIIVKQSAMAAAVRREESPDMDAPPDMLALCGDSSQERGSQTLEDRLRGCKRIFVCGLALDFCVLDTCLNARLGGFEHVVLLLDAARAAHIPGVGHHGTGFLSDPLSVVRQLRDAGVTIATYTDACQPGTLKSPSPRGVGTAAAPEEEGAFPDRLGPLGLETTSALGVTVDKRSDRYTIELTGNLAGLAGLNFANSGTCSPLAGLPEGWPAAPAGATGFRWAYPADGMAQADRLEFYTRFLGADVSVDKCFVAYGGFLLLDAAGRVLAVQAIMRTSTDATRQMHFSPQQKCPTDAVSHMLECGRMRSVTLPHLRRCGAESFGWVHPEEQVGPTTAAASQPSTEASSPRKPRPLSSYGAFLYTFSSGAPIIFHMINPGVILTSQQEARAQIKSVERQNNLRRALTIGQSMMNVDEEVKSEVQREDSRRRKKSKDFTYLPGAAVFAKFSLAFGRMSASSMVEGKRAADEEGRSEGGEQSSRTTEKSQFCVVM